MAETVETYAIPEHAAKLLLKVAQHILEEPTRYDQSTWIRESPRSPCGTAGCIAGWVVALGRVEQGYKLSNVLAGLKFGDSQVPYEALRILGGNESIKLRMAIDHSHLFTGDPGLRWPEPFVSEWRNLRLNSSEPGDVEKYLRRKAEIAAARIEHFVKYGW